MLATRAASVGSFESTITGGPNNGAFSGITDSGNAQSEKFYRLNRDWIYVVLAAISKRVSGLPFGAGTIKKEGGKAAITATKDVNPLRLPRSIKNRTANGRAIEQQPSHPAIDFLQRPNRLQGKTEFLECTILNLYLTGHFYWIGGDDGENGPEVWSVPSSWITPKHEGGLFTSYVLKIPGQPGSGLPLPAELVHRSYFTDPADFKKSLSPVSAEIRAIRIDEHIQSSQEKAFERGPHPDIAIEVGDRTGPDGQNLGKPVLTGAQRRQYIQAIREIWRAQSAAGDPAILDGLVKAIHKLQTSNNEMDWLQSGESVKKRIFQAFGVNPYIVGDQLPGSRAQSAVAEQNYVDNVINPLVDKISCGLQEFIVPMFDSDNDVNSGLAIWLEEAKPKDEELDMRKISQARAGGSASRNEERAVLSLPTIEGDAANLVGLASTAQGAAQAQSLIIAVSTGQIPRESAQLMLEWVYGFSAEQSKKLVAKVKPPDPNAAMPGAPGAAAPPAPAKPEATGKPDDKPPKKPEPPAIDEQGGDTGKGLKFDDSQARDDHGRWSEGGGSQSSAQEEERGIFTWGNISHGSAHVSIGDNGQIKLKNPKTPEAASAMLEAMNAIMDKATADMNEAWKRDHNELRLQTSIRLGHVKKQLSRAIGYARKIMDDYRSQKGDDAYKKLERLIAEICQRWQVEAIDTSGGDPELKSTGMRLIPKAPLPKLTRSMVKSHNANLRTRLEREAAVGLTPFFEISSSAQLGDLIALADSKRIPMRPKVRPPS